jgi:hypothetical protein
MSNDIDFRTHTNTDLRKRPAPRRAAKEVTPMDLLEFVRADTSHQLRYLHDLGLDQLRRYDLVRFLGEVAPDRYAALTRHPDFDRDCLEAPQGARRGRRTSKEPRARVDVNEWRRGWEQAVDARVDRKRRKVPV